MTTPQSQPRLLTPEELAMVVRMFREMRQWSQEQLSEISGLSGRTIQRVEQADPSSLDTRRALALAFGFEDIDAFSKPYVIPTEEERKAEKEKFDRENITLKALPLDKGRQLAELAETCSMDLTSPAFELSREAEEQLADLTDYFRDYRDVHECYSQRSKLEVHDDFQGFIDRLRDLEVSLRYATRKVVIKAATPDAQPMKTTVCIIAAFPLGKEPSEFATPREMKIGW